ncbi:Nn.00g030480.m01.CDS01 [Neocucurbitaria sp. VM-36]
MSYNLRPERKLKRPARYSSETGEECGGPSASTNHNVAAHSGIEFSHDRSVGVAAPRTQHLSPLTSQAPTPLTLAVQGAQATPRTSFKLNRSSAPKSHRRMPNVRYVRKRSQRPRVDSHHDYDHDLDTPSARRPIGRHTTPQTQPVPTSIFPSAKPASFPSLPTDRRRPEDNLNDGVHHGVRALMRAMEKSDKEGIRTYKYEVDSMYNNKHFPIHMKEEERQWYAELRQRSNPNSPTAQITFASLWPSLRQTIIEQTCDDFPPGTYYDSYHPVKCLLGLSQSEFKTIQDENCQVWNVEDDIPRYLLEFRRLHLNEIIDPDTPPEREVVKAIRFLRQELLPGSLLGEWQFPLPSIEAFQMWSSQACVGMSKKDHPDTLNSDDTLALLVRYGWEKSDQPHSSSLANNDMTQSSSDIRALIHAEAKLQDRKRQALAHHPVRSQKRPTPKDQNRRSVLKQTRSLPLDEVPTRPQAQHTETNTPKSKSPLASYTGSWTPRHRTEWLAAHNPTTPQTQPTPPKPSTHPAHKPDTKKRKRDHENPATRQRIRSAHTIPSPAQRCSQFTPTSSRYDNLSLRIRTVDQLQQQNRKHTGLRRNASTIKRLRDDLGVMDGFEYSYYDGPSTGDRRASGQAVEMVVESASAYAQAVAMDEVVARDDSV